MKIASRKERKGAKEAVRLLQLFPPLFMAVLFGVKKEENRNRSAAEMPSTLIQITRQIANGKWPITQS